MFSKPAAQVSSISKAKPHYKTYTNSNKKAHSRRIEMHSHGTVLIRQGFLEMTLISRDDPKFPHPGPLQFCQPNTPCPPPDWHQPVTIIHLYLQHLPLLATLALSNVDKPDQHIIEQDTTLFLTLHLFKLLECLEAWTKFKWFVFTFITLHFWRTLVSMLPGFDVKKIVLFHISRPTVIVSCY